MAIRDKKLPKYQVPLPIVSEEDGEELLKARTLYNAVKQTVRGVEYLHRPVEVDPGTCNECWQQMPCATRRALIELKLTAGIEDEITGAEDDGLTPEQRLLKAIFEQPDFDDDTEVEFGESHRCMGEDPIPGLEPPPDLGSWDGTDWRDYEKGMD